MNANNCLQKSLSSLAPKQVIARDSDLVVGRFIKYENEEQRKYFEYIHDKLKGQGIEAKLVQVQTARAQNQEVALELIARDDHPINRFIRRSADQFGGVRVFIRHYPAQSSVSGVYQTYDNAIFLNRKTALNLGEDSVDRQALFHEMRHAYYSQQTHSSIQSPYSGAFSVTNQDETLLGLNRSGYGKSVSLEESSTFIRDSLAYYRHLKNSFIENPAGPRISSLIEKLKYQSMAAREITRGIGVQFENMLKGGRIKGASFQLQEQKVMAVIRYTDDEGKENLFHFILNDLDENTLKAFKANKGDSEVKNLLLNKTRNSIMNAQQTAKNKYDKSMVNLWFANHLEHQVASERSLFTFKSFESSLGLGKKLNPRDSKFFKKLSARQDELNVSEAAKILSRFLENGKRKVKAGKVSIKHKDFSYKLVFDEEGHFLKIKDK